MENSKLIKATAITPIHVGAGQEKKLIPGVDYLYRDDGKKVIIIDQSRVFKLLPEEDKNLFISFLSAGTPVKFFENRKILKEEILNLAAISEIPSPSGPVNEEILPMISTAGENGRQVYIPGSSIKGSIRSVIYAWLKNKYKVRDERDAFGEISNNLMSFIHITDAFFKESRISKTKLFNLALINNEWTAGWANARKETSTNFNATGFLTILETITPTATSSFILKINNQRFDYLKQKKATLQGRIDFFNDLTIEKIFNIINWHSKRYLEAELDFFNHYDNGSEHSAGVISGINKLIKSIPSDNNRCLLHLGFGSGFHGITGDWQYPGDHINTGSGRRLKYKSRRLFFRTVKINGKDSKITKTEFNPLGFLLLEI
ncbi:MAG: type III-A CRISPR-associated RAMP protein Csm5 [Bacteroidales bacterium]|nr:type III-A CRISPR-associated RAMP protein Csm5 [Bacteroidales bacterium]